MWTKCFCYRENTHFLMAWSIKRLTGITVMAQTGGSTLRGVMGSNQQVWSDITGIIVWDHL